MKQGIGNIIRDLSHTNWIEQIINEALEKNISASRSNEFFHPSWAGNCTRLIQLMMFGLIKSDVNYKAQRIFDNGHSLHERYTGYFSKAAKLVGSEVPCNFTYKNVIVKGRADLVVRDYDGNKHLGEMKSINDRRFTEVLIANSPVEDNFLQWNVYSHGLKIQNGFVLYENKNDQRLLIFEVKFNEEKFNQVMNDFCFVAECNGKGKLVPKPSKCDPHWCKGANFCKQPDELAFNTAIKNLKVNKNEKEQKTNS